MPSTSIQYTLDPGENYLTFDCGRAAPLTNLRFVCGGRPDVMVFTFVGATNQDPTRVFNAGSTPRGASPFDVTQYFLDNPIASSPSSVFEVRVDNNTGGQATLHIGARYS